MLQQVSKPKEVELAEKGDDSIPINVVQLLVQENQVCLCTC